MIPLRVYVENFLSYRQGQKICFDGAPLWVLAGANGAGKSTIFDAIRFALYGVHRGGKQNAEDLINHQADFFVVEFDFQVDGQEYRVRRTVHRRGRNTREVFYLTPSVKPVPNTDNNLGFSHWVASTIGLSEEAFTSCVLLLQGQSDKLLSAQPKDRYEILKQLIDLSAYERLYEKANTLYQEYQGKVKGFNTQIDLIAVIPKEEVQIAQTRLNEAENDWQTIQKKVDELNILVEQFKQRKQLEAQIERQQKYLAQFQILIDKSDEIKYNFALLQELQQVIPLLKKCFEQRERLSKIIQHIVGLEKEIQQLQNNLTEEESQKNLAAQKVGEISNNIEQLQKQSTTISEKLLELAPIIEKTLQFEAIQEKLNKCDRNLTAFPRNLNSLLQQAEEQDKQLEELEKALPWLKQLAQFRVNLVDAYKKKQAASERLESLYINAKNHQNLCEQLSADMETARRDERSASQELTRAQTNYDVVYQQCDRFEKASHEQTCELCGQEITLEHAQIEKQRLLQQLATAKITVDNQTFNAQKAENDFKKIEKNLQSLSQQLASLQTKIERDEHQNQQAQKDIEFNTHNLQNVCNNLPVNYRLLVSSYELKTSLAWLNTTYPNNTDLEELQQKLSIRESQTKNLQQLRQQLEESKKLDSERQTYRKQIDEIASIISLSHTSQIRSQQNDLQQTKKQLESQLQKQKKEQQTAKVALESAIQTVTQLSHKLQLHQNKIAENQVRQEEIQQDWQSNLERLPEIRQKQATTIEADELNKLEQQYFQLFAYESLAENLSHASQSVTHVKEEITNLKTQIGQLPEAVQYPINEQELKDAKTQREILDVARKNAEKEFNQLLEQHKRRYQLEQDLKATEQECHRYELLAKYLSKRGIQLHILHHAELAIVEIANEILDSLSRGRMRLQLRGDSEQSGSQSDKALDLVAYNYDTGDRPTAVALTSGSQRFRIAVSLALAIGQYAGQGARHIESVIIDEGFGSLDKNGRDDMIQELNELQTRLARIILVSHQEEFFSAFPNGYAVELVNGASQVRPIDSDRL